MTNTSLPRFETRWRSFWISGLAGFALLWATGALSDPRTLYTSLPFFRAQVFALMEGRLSLSSNPLGLMHDLVWADGVHQTWGLGIPLLTLPFEALGRLFGFVAFPDRLVLLIYLIGTLFFVRRTCLFITPSRWKQAGLLFGVVACPALVAMLKARFAVYEETILYVYLANLWLASCLVRMRFDRARRWYVVGCAIAGVSVFIRPTQLFAAAALWGIATAYLLWQQRDRRSLVIAVVGSLVFSAQVGAVAWTNYAKFGSPVEFGHSLAVHDLPGNIYATRFDYPFRHIGFATAAKDLVGGLLGRPERAWKLRKFYQRDLHFWQAPDVRWRDYYFTVMDFTWLPLLVLGAFALARNRSYRVLGAWTAVTLAGVLAFYLRSPSASSRYYMDAGLPFALLVIAGGWQFLAWAHSRPMQYGAVAVLAIWWLHAFFAIRVRVPYARGLSRKNALEATYNITRPDGEYLALGTVYDRTDANLVRLFGRDTLDREYRRKAIDFTARYVDYTIRRTACDQAHSDGAFCPDEDPPERPERLGMLQDNGTKWNLETGEVPPGTLFFVEKPDHLALTLEGEYPDEVIRTQVRARLGLIELAQTAIERHAGTAVVRFAVPAHLQTKGLQVVFLAFGPPSALDKSSSGFKLKRVEWR